MFNVQCVRSLWQKNFLPWTIIMQRINIYKTRGFKYIQHRHINTVVANQMSKQDTLLYILALRVVWNIVTCFTSWMSDNIFKKKNNKTKIFHKKKLHKWPLSTAKNIYYFVSLQLDLLSIKKIISMLSISCYNKNIYQAFPNVSLEKLSLWVVF